MLGQSQPSAYALCLILHCAGPAEILPYINRLVDLPCASAATCALQLLG